MTWKSVLKMQKFAVCKYTCILYRIWVKSGNIKYRIMLRYRQKDGWIELVAIWKKVLTKSHQKHVHIYDNIDKYFGSYKSRRDFG